MEIRKTKNTELDAVLNIYENARKFMADHGNPTQWGNTEPTEKQVIEDIESGNSYVCVENEEIIATFYFFNGPDKIYDKIYEGQWLNEKEYGVVHRIATTGKVRGTGSYCINWAVNKCGNLKIDTHEDNIVMQNMLKKNGFLYCGIIYIEDGSKRLAFQKNERME